jgi:hypothetical protein
VEAVSPTDTRHRKQKKHPKYTQFDDRGIPTQDRDQQEIGSDERAVLGKMMQDKINRIRTESVVTELKDGGMQIEDASLMFRGMVIAK